MKRLELISVHVPKCAGSSLRKSLLNYYGKENLYLDYDDKPLNVTSEMHINALQFFSEEYQSARNDISCYQAIHGHFNIRKYDHIKDVMKITFLRNPIDRLISHFHFWKTKPFTQGNPLRAAVFNGDVDLITFSNVAPIKYLYSGVFFLGVNMKNFDFIGCFENSSDAYSALKDKLGLSLKIHFENKNMSKGYNQDYDQYLSDKRLMETLKANLRQDIAFYEKWVS